MLFFLTMTKHRVSAVKNYCSKLGICSSWILPVRQGDMPAMLKVARIPDEEAGYRLLTWWDGQGAARVFASAAGALLMERASGAGDLAQIAWSGQDDEACRIGILMFDSLSSISPIC